MILLGLFWLTTLTNFLLIAYQILIHPVNVVRFVVYFEIGRVPPEPSGVSLAHSVHRECIWYEIWGRKGDRTPLEHSPGLLCVNLCALWQHMYAMLGCRGNEERIWNVYGTYRNATLRDPTLGLRVSGTHPYIYI